MENITLSDIFGAKDEADSPRRIGIAIIGGDYIGHLARLAEERCLLITPSKESKPLIFVVPDNHCADLLRIKMVSVLKNCVFENINLDTEQIDIINNLDAVVPVLPRELCLEIKMQPINMLDSIIIQERIKNNSYPKYDTYKPRCNHAHSNNKYSKRKPFIQRRKG